MGLHKDPGILAQSCGLYKRGDGRNASTLAKVVSSQYMVSVIYDPYGSNMGYLGFNSSKKKCGQTLGGRRKSYSSRTGIKIWTGICWRRDQFMRAVAAPANGGKFGESGIVSGVMIMLILINLVLTQTVLLICFSTFQLRGERCLRGH